MDQLGFISVYFINNKFFPFHLPRCVYVALCVYLELFFTECIKNGALVFGSVLYIRILWQVKHSISVHLVLEEEDSCVEEVQAEAWLTTDKPYF